MRINKSQGDGLRLVSPRRKACYYVGSERGWQLSSVETPARHTSFPEGGKARLPTDGGTVERVSSADPHREN